MRENYRMKTNRNFEKKGNNGRGSSSAKNTKGIGHGRVESRGKNNHTAYLSIHKVQRSDTLLEFLLAKCNTSRNNVKALLSRRQVLVNGSVVTQFDFALAKDDEVRVARDSVPVGEGIAKAAKPSKQVKPKTAETPVPKVTVLYEDDDLIAVDKPVGLLSVESDKETECAFAQVLQYLQSKDKSLRPFILHRIDKETSGVLVFAKDIKIHSMLKMHWNELVSLREYYAVVEGVLEEKSGTITSYLKENKNNLVYATNDPTGQKAITHYEVVEENGEYSLLKVKIDTGRKNQIRVQLKAKGHAVVGDEKYGALKNPLTRLGLHASCLTFQSPITKELITFRAPVPAVFRALFGK